MPIFVKKKYEGQIVQSGNMSDGTSPLTRCVTVAITNFGCAQLKL